MRKLTIKLLVVALLGLFVVGYQLTAESAEACPYARAHADAEIGSGEALPVGVSLLDASSVSPAIFP